MQEATSSQAPSSIKFPALRWWHGVLIGLVAAWLPGPALVLFVYLSPLIVLRLIEAPNENYRLIAGGFFVIAALAAPLHNIWTQNGDWDACLAAITQPIELGLDWSAVALSWFITEATAITLRLLRARQYAQRVKFLKERAASLREEWGLDGESPSSPQKL